ncbi:MAG: TIGR02391 family protein [Burkholderiales bacterium]|nr:TIGR02391 family protein [Burkholderiales bacterium]
MCALSVAGPGPRARSCSSPSGTAQRPWRTSGPPAKDGRLINLIKGLLGAFRNTTAHAPKIHWNVSEQDALHILTTVSLVHRRLDAAVCTHIP